MLDAIPPLAAAGILHAEWPPLEEFLAVYPHFKIFASVGSNYNDMDQGYRNKQTLWIFSGYSCQYPSVLLYKYRIVY